MEDRPLQIIHGFRVRPGMGPMPPGAGRDEIVKRRMEYYRDRGLGGVVCNVAWKGYMDSEDNWKTLVSGVEACRRLGMVVWIYDEQGYPSGAAAGKC